MSELTVIFSSYCSSIGMPPETAPFIIAAGVQSSLMHGVYSPVKHNIADSLKEAILKRGGECKTGAESGKVKNILFDEGRAVGVTTADGTEIYAKVIVSDVGIKNSVQNLIPQQHCTPALTKASELSSSSSGLVLRLGFDKSITKFTDSDRTYRSMSKAPFTLSQDPTEPGWVPPNAVLVFNFPEDGAESQEGFVGEIMALTEYAHFEKFKNLPEQDYIAAKEKITNDLIEKVLLHWFPAEIRTCIQYTDLDTPIDNFKSTRHNHGAIYGLSSTMKKFEDPEILPDSGIEGLYFSGADIIAQGVTTCVTEGVLTASAIVDENLIETFGNKINMNSDNFS